MTFANSVRVVLKQKYADFHGRASRSEFWWFQLFIWVIYAILFALTVAAAAAAAGTASDATAQAGFNPYGILPIIGFVLIGLFTLATIIPGLALAARRLHDLNYSGWWVAALYIGSGIPYIGGVVAIIAIIIMGLKGTNGANRFGSDPLGKSA